MKKIELPDGCQVMTDDVWYMFLTYWKWKHHPFGYVYRSDGKGKDQRLIFMHRVIKDAKPRERVSFKDKNPLNCQEENLKKITIKRKNDK